MSWWIQLEREKLTPGEKREVLATLRDAKAEFDSLPPKDQSFFDEEKLANPYSDTRISNGQGDEEVKRSSQASTWSCLRCSLPRSCPEAARKSI